MIAKCPLVLVVWEDTVHRNGWRSSDEAKEFLKGNFLVGSAGYLVKKTKKTVLLAHGVAYESGEWHDLLCIPRPNVKSICRMRTKNDKARPKIHKKRSF